MIRWSSCSRSTGGFIGSKADTGSSSRSAGLNRRRSARTVCATRLRFMTRRATDSFGFDNAHAADSRRRSFKTKPAAADHWHRTPEDAGRPYRFKDADTLIADFFSEVRRVLTEQGATETVVRVEEKRKPHDGA